MIDHKTNPLNKYHLVLWDISVQRWREHEKWIGKRFDNPIIRESYHPESRKAYLESTLNLPKDFVAPSGVGYGL